MTDRVTADGPSWEAPAVSDDSGTEENGRAAEPPKNDNALEPEDLSLVEQHGSYVLCGVAVIAWVLALFNVDRDAVATAWIVAGFVLFAAAAFFSRVIKIGREGLELARVRQRIREARGVRPQEGDTPDEAAERVLAFLDEGVEAGVESDVEAQLSRDAARRRSFRREQLKRVHAESNLISGVSNWLSRKGYSVAREWGDQVRVDLMAEKDGEVVVVEVRPAIDSLSASDAAAIVTRKLPGEIEGAHRAVVIRSGVFIWPEAREALDAAGIAIWTADPEGSSTVSVVSQGSLPPNV